MSKYDICRKFKKVTGKSFSEYLTEIRIRQAIEYLNTTQLTVREIASLTGFSSPNYFSEVFLKKQGLPPNKYRRMI